MGSRLEGLDESQLAAVTHDGAWLLVLGGAGAGKTRVTCERFLWLVERGTPPDGIVALSSSAAAATSMRTRLETAIDSPYEELQVASLPAFCVWLLKQEALELGLDPGFSPVTRADRLALLLERIDALPLRRHEIRGNPAPLLAGFIARIDRLKGQLITAADYHSWARTLEAHDGSSPPDAGGPRADRELEFASLYERHDELLRAAGVLDSGDVALEAVRLLDERPHVRERQADRFRHVLVDDYQDVGLAHAALIRLLGREHGNVAVAGDDDQAIQRARGAARNSLDEFRREHPDAALVRLERSHRSGRRILRAAAAVVEPVGARIEKRLSARAGGDVRFWRCSSERAQAQAVAREAERLVTTGVTPGEICVLVRSLGDEGGTVGAALEERAVPFRLAGAAAYFQRAEVRDALAWLRLLADPGDAGAVVRALSRPPIELRAADIARLTQLARRRKLDMVSGVAAACEGPQLSPEGRERAGDFLRLYRAAQPAFEEMRPDAFVHRLIERIGLRRQQLFALQADTAERLVNIAKLGALAASYMRREPNGTAREFARYVAAVAEAGQREEEPSPAPPGAVQVMAMHSASGLEFDHVLVIGLGAARVSGARGQPLAPVPDALLKEQLPASGADTAEDELRRLLYVAMTRARKRLVLAWAEPEAGGAEARPARLYEEARGALGAAEEIFEEELFGPAEGLYSTFRMMRDELLDSVAGLGGRLAEMRLDTYLDVSQGVARYLELVKLAALIERSKKGQPVEEALAEVNELLLQSATSEQRDAFLGSALDDYLRDTERQDAQRRRRPHDASDPSLEPFIPRRGDGLMLSASDIETYRICPLKYKFARVFRIPQEPTINQRFGILLHQVLERFHSQGGGSLATLMELFEGGWRRAGFGDSNDDLQFRERAVAALARYWEAERDSESEAVWFERSFAFKLGPHLLRGRVDRVDRLPDGRHELIDYKTGKPRTSEQLRDDVQLSLYQMGARTAWGLDASAQSYYYVLDNEKVPVDHSEGELERVRTTVADIADGILGQHFEPTPSEEICPFCDYRIICPAAET